MRNPECFGFPFGCVAVVSAAAAAGLLGAAEQHGYSLLAQGAVVFAAGVATTVGAALGTAVIAWAVHSGFTVGALGELDFSSETAFAAAVFLGATTAGSIARAALRREKPSREKSRAGPGRTAAPLRLRVPLPTARVRLRPGSGPRHSVGLRD